MDQKMSKKRISLNDKKYNQRLWDTNDTVLQNVTVEDKCPTVADILASTIVK